MVRNYGLRVQAQATESRDRILSLVLASGMFVEISIVIRVVRCDVET